MTDNRLIKAKELCEQETGKLGKKKGEEIEDEHEGEGHKIKEELGG